jgi:LemA protein
MIIYIVIAVVGILLIGLWAIYNGLIKARVRTDEALSDITVQEKRRLDLIPNLIETVKGYVKHERGTFESVTKARTAVMDTPDGDLAKRAENENMLSGTLKSLFAVSENYPDLKADSSFLNLQNELSDTEDKIQAARRFYNGNVRDFNMKLQVCPTNMIGGSLGFKSREFYDVAESEKDSIKKAPEVKL